MKLNRARLTLILIFLLFATPVVVAVLMNSSWWGYRPGGMTNLGTLVQPPQPLDYQKLDFAEPAWDTSVAGRWVILYPVSDPCVDRCLEDIASLRQIHRAAGRRQDQLLVMPLIPASAAAAMNAQLLEVYAAFLPARDSAGEAYTQLGSLAGGKLQPGQAFLVDPGGNIMMRYAEGFDPNHLNKDLKRLLKWSGQDG